MSRTTRRLAIENEVLRDARRPCPYDGSYAAGRRESGFGFGLGSGTGAGVGGVPSSGGGYGSGTRTIVS